MKPHIYIHIYIDMCYRPPCTQSCAKSSCPYKPTNHHFHSWSYLNYEYVLLRLVHPMKGGLTFTLSNDVVTNAFPSYCGSGHHSGYCSSHTNRVNTLLLRFSYYVPCWVHYSTPCMALVVNGIVQQLPFTLIKTTQTSQSQCTSSCVLCLFTIR